MTITMIIFICLEYGSFDSINKHIENINLYNEKCIIVINLSSECLHYQQIWSDKFTNVLFPEKHSQIIMDRYHNDQQQGGYHRAFINCYLKVKEYDYSHIVFLASNELFFRKGVERYLSNYDTVKIPENHHMYKKDTNYYTCSIKNIACKTVIEELENCYCHQWEGFFISKNIMNEIYNKYGTLMLDGDIGDTGEEILIPTIIRVLYNDKSKYKLGDIITKSRLVSFEELGSIDDIKKFMIELESNYFSIKRVDKNNKCVVRTIIESL